MKKLYTLQQCFEALGSKFPFNVNFYIDEKCYNFTFTHKFKNNTNELFWVTKETNTYNYGEHFIWALEKMYDYKTPKYEKDFEELLRNE